jgi:uncharacterized protein YbbK (DUF523 family)
MGVECKYCGGSNKLNDEELDVLNQKFNLIPVCPETAGGLPTPRDPSERLGEAVVSNKGKDVTAEFEKGANMAVKMAELYECRFALMKEHSPSCGSGAIYDGTFTGKLVSGDGVAAEKLKEQGLIVFGESDIKLLTEVFQN